MCVFTYDFIDVNCNWFWYNILIIVSSIPILSIIYLICTNIYHNFSINYCSKNYLCIYKTHIEIHFYLLAMCSPHSLHKSHTINK